MDIQEYIEQMKNIQNKTIEFIDNDQDIEEHCQNLINIYEDLKIRNNEYRLKTLLYILSNISNNHHRYPKFFEKIEKILHLFEHEIKENFSNYEIFKIFKTNKRILRFLINSNMLYINEDIKNKMKKEKYESFNFFIYLFPEITLKIKSTNEIDDKFENKLNEGENEYLITKMIRNDSINDFISYVKQNDYPLDSFIKRSIFETNVFLINRPNITIIEYAAFFGSNQIFEYLCDQGIKLTSSLWLYSIHGNNPKIFNHLIKNKIQISTYLYNECIYESIKCHHNNVVLYLKENIKAIIGYNSSNADFILSCFQYYNFSCFLEKINDVTMFNYACKYDYSEIVKYFLEKCMTNNSDKI